MTHPSDSSGNSRSYRPAEFLHGANFMFYQSGEEQSAHAELMRADAAYKREEIKKLKFQNRWHRLGIAVAGFATYGITIVTGFALGFYSASGG